MAKYKKGKEEFFCLLAIGKCQSVRHTNLALQSLEVALFWTPGGSIGVDVAFRACDLACGASRLIAVASQLATLALLARQLLSSTAERG